MGKERILLQEFLEVKNAKIDLYEEEEKKATGFLGSFKGVAHNVGRITKNKTLYRRSLMHREVERIQPMLGEGKIVALADHPGWDTNQVLTLAVRWTKAWIDNSNDLRVEGGILKTNAGKEVRRRARAACSLRSRFAVGARQPSRRWTRTIPSLS